MQNINKYTLLGRGGWHTMRAPSVRVVRGRPARPVYGAANLRAEATAVVGQQSHTQGRRLVEPADSKRRRGVQVL